MQTVDLPFEVLAGLVTFCLGWFTSDGVFILFGYMLGLRVWVFVCGCLFNDFVLLMVLIVEICLPCVFAEALVFAYYFVVLTWFLAILLCCELFSSGC